jgi:hypothetical protein
VLACTASALFDEQVLADPGAFRTDRPSRVDLHFGYGHHSCLGRHLGEQVVPEMVRRVLLRPGVSLYPGAHGQLDRSGLLPERFLVALASGPEAQAFRVPVPDTTPDGRCTDRDGRLNKLEFWVLTHGAPVWSGVQRSRLLQRGANHLLINRAALRLPPRPNALSTMVDYPSWPSLTDRSYDARHLPPMRKASGAPDLDEVAALFRRRPETERACPKSSLLFAYFAQWFTDGFLRSARGRIGQNETSHEIDLSQLYGRTPDATKALRSFEGWTAAQPAHRRRGVPAVPVRGRDIKPEFDALSVSGSANSVAHSATRCSRSAVTAHTRWPA